MDLPSEVLQTALANTAPRTSENANSTFYSQKRWATSSSAFSRVVILQDNGLTCVEGWLFNFVFAFAISHISFRSLINTCLTFGDGST